MVPSSFRPQPDWSLLLITSTLRVVNEKPIKKTDLKRESSSSMSSKLSTKINVKKREKKSTSLHLRLKRLQLRAETAWAHLKVLSKHGEERKKLSPGLSADWRLLSQRIGGDDGPTCEEKPPSRAGWRARSTLKWKWEKKVELESGVRTVRSAGNKSRLVLISERSWELLRSADTRTVSWEDLSAPQRVRCWIKSILCFSSSHRPAPVCVCVRVCHLQITDWIHTGSGSWSRWRGFKSQRSV